MLRTKRSAWLFRFDSEQFLRPFGQGFGKPRQACRLQCLKVRPAIMLDSGAPRKKKRDSE